MNRRTKIVATLGPSTDEPEVLHRLVRAGVDVVRLNLSHGEVDDHLAAATRVREVAAELGRAVAVLADLPGPKVRCGSFPEGGVQLRSGSTVTVAPGDGPCDDRCLHVDYPALLEDIGPGDVVLVGDGGITLRTTEVTSGHATAEVVSGGRATGRPGFHIPSERLRLEMYKRLAEVRADEDVDLLREELLDRYGEPPEPVAALLLVARFRARARQAGISEVTIAGRNVRFAPVSLPESRVLRLHRMYPKSIVKAQLDTILVPRPGSGGRPLEGVALLEWARTVIDAVIDPKEQSS